MPRWLTAPYRLLWGIVLDCALGRVQEFEYKGSTTPLTADDLDPDEYGITPAEVDEINARLNATVQEDSDEVGYYRDV